MPHNCDNVNHNGQNLITLERREFCKLYSLYLSLWEFDEQPSKERLKEVVKKKRNLDSYYE